MVEKYKALVTEEFSDKSYQRSIKQLNINDLPDNDVLIKVAYSSLNYKDALSARGHKGITRKYPHTPGIDASGFVVKSKSTKFNVGDEILVTGYDLGMNTSGGFGGYISVPADWVVSVPKGLDLKTAMIFGTAGFTAGISLYELQKMDVLPPSGDILVTGATGGVGSLAVAILSKAGYKIVASTGKTEKSNWLKSLGACKVIDRNELNQENKKPLLDKRWIGSIETVGGITLENVIKSTDHRGGICTMGNAASDNFSMTVYPFILRGVKLIGIDSASRPMHEREYIWNKLAGDWKPVNFGLLHTEVTLAGLSAEIDKILAGGQVGRILIKHDE